jgi:hypothetical protein
VLARWAWKKYIFKRKLVQVTGKTFENERVPLDGREHSYCKFNNVTLSSRRDRSGPLSSQSHIGWHLD